MGFKPEFVFSEDRLKPFYGIPPEHRLVLMAPSTASHLELGLVGTMMIELINHHLNQVCSDVGRAVGCGGRTISALTSNEGPLLPKKRPLSFSSTTCWETGNSFHVCFLSSSFFSPSIKIFS